MTKEAIPLNPALCTQRKLRGWSQAKLAELIGASEEMISKWERGKKKTSPFYQEKLCELFGMNAQELGFLEPPTDTSSPLSSAHTSEETEQKAFFSMLPIQVSTKTLFVVPLAMNLTERADNPGTHLDCATWFGLKHAEMVTLIHQWSGMATFCHTLQNQLDQEIKALDLLKARYHSKEFSLSRRSLLIALAALPSALLSTSKQGQKVAFFLEELLPQCAASLTACWHLSGGNHLDAITPILDSYLPTLITVVKSASSYREVTADLVAQCYFLKTILAWHGEGLHRAEIFCIQALYYSEIAKNTNLRLNALNQHALISYYAKQFPKALAKSEEASSLLQQETLDHIFPIMQGRVSMYLAAIQAANHESHAQKTLEQAKHAFALQTTAAEPVPLYADCGNAPLTLWEGLTHYHLSSHDATSAQRALIALRTFGQLQSQTEIPERFRLECLNNRVLAAVQCNEMEEALTCWKMGKQGSEALASKQRNQEIDFAYQALLRQWPGEMKIQNLTHEHGLSV
jgi:transcriptional regulator with XRE-family HTH domain